jgi:hypothetical protein
MPPSRSLAVLRGRQVDHGGALAGLEGVERGQALKATELKRPVFTN